MEEFLDALTPSVREKTEAALALDAGQARLERVVGRYIDDEGNWPSDPKTANFLARSFIDQSAFAMPRFGASGLTGTTIAGLATGAVTVAVSEGLVIAGSEFVDRYWADIIGYSLGVSPSTIRKVKSTIDFFTNDTRWAEISDKLKNGFSELAWMTDFGDKYAEKLASVLLGEFADAAWRGTRSAANHATEQLVGDVTVNQWVKNYVAKVAKQQAELSKRTAQRIVEDAIENGLSRNVIAGRLRELWALTPTHVDSVNRYRRRLQTQDRTYTWVEKTTNRYRDRLLNRRIKTFAETEVLTAFNLGREAQWMDSVRRGILPADTKKMWVTARDEAVCEVCGPMDGETAPLGEKFVGIELYVPSAHPNCRCITIPVQPGVVNVDTPELVFPVRDTVNKRTIIIPEYERQDGTTVRRHTRVVGERDAMERWKDAEPTEEHVAIAKEMRKLGNQLWERGDAYRYLPDTPPNFKSLDDFDNWEDYDEWLSKYQDTEEGKTYFQERQAARRRRRAVLEKEMRAKLEKKADPELVQSVIRGSRLWTTVIGGTGLVREIAGLTPPGHVPTEDYIGRRWRESEIKAASDLVNTVHSAPFVNNRVFYRGMSLPNTDEFKSLREDLQTGAVLNIPISSVSESKDVAENFMYDRGEDPIRVLFKFNRGSRSLRLPNPISNPYFMEDEWATTGRYRIASVEENSSRHGDYIFVTLNYANDSISKTNTLNEIESRLCTPFPQELLNDEVSKRTITVEEYTRRDGTVVEEHERKIDPAKPKSEARTRIENANNQIKSQIKNPTFFEEDEFDTGDALTTLVAGGIAAGVGWYVPIGLKQHILARAGRLAPVSTDVFSSFKEARELDRTYKATSTLDEMDELGAYLVDRGFTIENTYQPGAAFRESVRNTEGVSKNINELTNKNIAARAGSHYHGSPAENAMKRGIHEAAQRVFGLRQAVTKHFKAHDARSQQAISTAFGGTDGSGYDTLVRAQYAATQRHLANNGIEQMPVARGMKGTREQAREMGIPVIESLDEITDNLWRRTSVDLQPLNSVTPNPTVAARFATGVTKWSDDVPKSERVSFIYRRVVGSEEVYSTHRSGMGISDWDEWVTLGGRQKWEVVAVNPDLLLSRGTGSWKMGRRAQKNLEKIWNSGL